MSSIINHAILAAAAGVLIAGTAGAGVLYLNPPQAKQPDLRMLRRMAEAANAPAAVSELELSTGTTEQKPIVVTLQPRRSEAAPRSGKQPTVKVSRSAPSPQVEQSPAPPSQSTPPPVAAPAPDPLRSLMLVGVSQEGGRDMALMVDASTNSRESGHVGDTVFGAQIREIQTERVLVERDGQQRWVALGAKPEVTASSGGESTVGLTSFGGGDSGGGFGGFPGGGPQGFGGDFGGGFRGRGGDRSQWMQGMAGFRSQFGGGGSGYRGSGRGSSSGRSFGSSSSSSRSRSSRSSSSSRGYTRTAAARNSSNSYGSSGYGGSGGYGGSRFGGGFGGGSRFGGGFGGFGMMGQNSGSTSQFASGARVSSANPQTQRRTGSGGQLPQATSRTNPQTQRRLGNSAASSGPAFGTGNGTTTFGGRTGNSRTGSFGRTGR